ncbi:hypothetical protein T459_32376 [Capsicum annuum]|uniref:Replication factor A C-terminal domain-containing protein n=1 Tax=Capsicum annuum TaxID=4072 RepID=A0A2G2Y271_CAPAN|nr:hypothetical protein T459_32376 [Capsicum annuum]
MDGAGSISLMIWDTDAMSLIGKSTNDLKEELLQNTGNDDSPSYPMKLNNILQRKFIFKVIVKNENIQNHDKESIKDGKMLTFLKTYAKRNRSSKKDKSIIVDEIVHGQLSSNKIHKGAKKKKKSSSAASKRLILCCFCSIIL